MIHNPAHSGFSVWDATRPDLGPAEWQCAPDSLHPPDIVLWRRTFHRRQI